MIYYLLCILLALSQLSLASTGGPNDSDVQEFVDYFQAKVGGENVLPNEMAVRMSNTVEKILSESKVSTEMRKLILEDAKEYIKASNIADCSKAQIEDCILTIQDMFFFSANFPKDKDKQLLVSNQINNIYDRAELEVETILKSEGEQQLLVDMRKSFIAARESSQSVAQSWFYPAHSKLIPDETVNHTIDEFVANVKKQVKGEQQIQLATLELKKMYLIDVPINNFRDALLIASDPPPIHSVKKKSSNKSSKKSEEHIDMISKHPVAIAFYLLTEISKENE